MLRFYASIQGNRGQATRQGTPNSGIQGHLRGWNLGARVYVDVGLDGKDQVSIYLTSGSNGRKVDKKIGTFTEENLNGKA